MPRGTYTSKRIALTIPEPLWSELERLRKASGRHRSQILHAALEEHLMKSQRNQDMEQVALIITEAGWEHDYPSAMAYAMKINDTDGWNFEANYASSPIGGYTRVEGLQLSKSELSLAVRLAEAWSAGDTHLTAAQLRVPMKPETIAS